MVRPIALYRAVPADRMRDLGLLAGLTAWLLYTRFYWTLHVSHVALPPCPFCGGTRSFAYMWQGDLTDAVRLYPLGPLFFVGSLVGAGGLVSGVITGRTWSLNLSSRQWRLLTIGAVSAIAASWALKVFVLGN